MRIYIIKMTSSNATMEKCDTKSEIFCRVLVSMRHILIKLYGLQNRVVFLIVFLVAAKAANFRVRISLSTFIHVLLLYQFQHICMYIDTCLQIKYHYLTIMNYIALGR